MKFALQDRLIAAISLHRFLKICSCLFDCSFSSSINRYLHLFICVGGSIYLHVCMRACILASVMSNSLQPCGLQPVRLPCPWDCPGKNTGVGCHALLQGVFPTEGLNPGLPHCRRILYPLSHQRNAVYVYLCQLHRTVTQLIKISTNDLNII